MSVSTLFPILRTTDLARLSTFYETAFGASVTYRFTDEGTAVYVSLRLGASALGIGAEPDVARGAAIAVWLYVDDADAAYESSIRAGASVIAPPEDMPWGERVAQVRDPDENLLYLATAGPTPP